MGIKKTLLFLNKQFMILFLLVSALSWGQTTGIITITQSSSGITQNGYDGGAERNWSQNGVNFGAKYVMKEGGQSRIQFQANNGVIYNKTALPGRIVKLTINQNNNNSFKLYVSNSGNIDLNPSNQLGGNSSTGWIINETSNYTYFSIKKNSGAAYWNSLTIEYELSPPVLNVTPEQLTNFTYEEGNGPSAAQTIQVTGSDLTGNLIVNSNGAFSVSVDDLYYQTISFPYFTGTLQTFYVKLNENLPVGNYNGTLTFTSSGVTKTVNLSGSVTQVLGPPVITTTAFTGTYGVPFNQQIEATNNPTFFDATDGFFPYGLVLNSVTGVFNGDPTTAGTFSATFIAYNQHGASPLQIITFNIAKANQALTLNDLTKGNLDTPFDLPQTTNQNLPVTYSSSDPSIATVNGNQVTILGVGTATITASNGGDTNHHAFTTTFQLNVVETPVIQESTLTTTVGTTVAESLTFTPQNATISLANGSSLPSGLSISSSGQITGMATEAGNFTTDIIASNDGVTSLPKTIYINVLSTSSCLTEDFSSLSEGNNTASSGSSSQASSTPLFPTIDTGYQAGDAIRMGSSNSDGFIETANLNNISGTVEVSIAVKGWTSVEGHLIVSLGNDSQNVTYTAKMNQAFETKTVVFENVPAGSKLKIETSAKRAFIDHVEICQSTQILNVCEGATIASLDASFENESNLTWYASENATVAFNTNFELIEAIYFKQIGNETSRTSYLVEINPAPTAPVVDPQTFCGPQTIANLPQDGGKYKWYESATSVDTLNVSEALATGSYFVSTTENGCESERTEVQVTINTIPTAPVVAAQTFCGPQTIANLPQDGGKYKWYATATSTVVLNQTESLATDSYFVSTTENGCESERTEVQVTIHVIPNAPTVDPQTFCGSTRIANLPQSEGKYKWYETATSADVLSATTALATGSYFVSTTENGCESERIEVQVTINVIPNAPTVAAQTFCGPQTIANLPQGEGKYKWYETATTTDILSATTALATGIYYVSTTENGCESERTEIQVTINDIPTAPVVAAQTFCGAQTIANLPQGEGKYKWYETVTSTVVLNQTEALATGSYYVSTTENACESERTEVQVTINTIPDAPTVDPQTFCGAQTIAALPNGNNTYKWYETATSADILNVTTALATRSYFVSTTENGCESERTEVQVTINTIPNAPTVDVQTFCGPQTIANLPQDGGKYKWYATATSTVVLNQNEALATDSYFVSTTENGCESERTQVQVTIHVIPTAPTVAAQTFCGAQTIANLPQDGGKYKWYETATSATALNATTALATGSYFVSTTENGCESERTEVQVTINTIPDAPTVAAQTFCGAQTITALSNGNNTYKWYEAQNANQALATDFVISTSGSYFVSTIENGCESERTEVQVTINAIPTAPTVGAQDFCDAATVADLPNGNNTYKWYATATSLDVLNVTQNLATASYFVSTTSNENCESDRTEVQVTINTTPEVPTVEALTFCGAQTVADLPNGNNTYKWYATQNANQALATDFVISTSGSYFVSSKVNNCESEKSEVQITINAVPNAPILVDYVFCGNKKISDLDQGQGKYKWYATEMNGQALSLTTDLQNLTYYVSTTENGCESIRTAVQVTIHTIPATPSVDTQNFCDAATVADLPQGNTGNNYKWFASATSDVALNLTDTLTAGTYYALASNGNCESSKTAVQVTIGTTPTAPNIENQQFCVSAKVSDLPQGTNNSYKWYNSATSNTPLTANTNLVNGVTYYVSEKNDVCESTRTPVQVIIINVPTVTANTIQTFCGTATVADLIATGIANAEIVWYNAPLATIPLTNQTSLINGTYYVAQKASGCESERKAVTVRVVNTDGPIVSPFEFCGSAQVSDLIIIAQSGITHKWYNSPTNTNVLPANTSLTTGTYFVSKVQYGCESERTAVQIFIKDLPASPTGNANQTFIEGSTINHLVVQPSNAIWYSTIEDAKTGTNPLVTDMPLVQNTTYYAVVIGTNGCPSLPLAVTVTITLDDVDFIKKEMKYYPNPVIDVLTIEHTQVIEQVVVYNTVGQHIATNSYNDSKVQIDFSSFASGTYMVKVFTKRGEAFLKIVKQ